MRSFKTIRLFILCGLTLVLAHPLFAQVITSFDPPYGSPGDKMTITGNGFQNLPLYVNYWNNVPLIQATIVGDTKIDVTSVPSGISTGPIGVSHDAITWNYSAEIFTKIDSWAYIDDVEPSYGAVGDTIKIVGAHFGSSPVVKFGGVTASAVANASGREINTFVPSGAPSNSVITVTASGGTYTNPASFVVVGAGPYVAEFTPHVGSDTQPVTLKGLHFTGTTSVRFNGQNAAFQTPTSDIELKATAPSGVTTGPITVVTPQGSNTTTSLFYGPIRLKDFVPTSGQVGDQVIINGTNFTGATSVKFGGFTGVSAPFTVNNNNQIVVSVPTNGPTGAIAVFTPSGSLAFSSNFFVTPSITSFSPQSGAAGTPVQITGTRLIDNGGGAPVVKFNGMGAVVNNWSPQQVLVTAPVSSSGYITLATADGTNTAPMLFYYPPQITTFTPNAAPPGSTVTITGQSLTNASSVLFNGVPSTNFTVLSNSSVQAVVPFGITTGPITITTPGGTINSAAPYYAQPVITAFAPASGRPGTNVTIFGTSLQGTTSVKFNGTSASFSGVTANQFTAVVPAGASSGPISLTAPAGTATSAEIFLIPLICNLRMNTFLNVPNPVAVSNDLTLTIVPANDGPNTASNVTASVTLGANVRVKFATTTRGSVDTAGDPVVFSIGSMDMFSNPTLKLVLEPLAAGSLTNVATLDSSTLDSNTGNNSQTRVTSVVGIPELSISLDPLDQVRVAWPSQPTNYVLQSTLKLTNAPAWTDVNTTPIIQGSQRVVTQPATGSAKFYRLRP